jgi:dTDP-glucose pyrophosphorylase
MNLDRNRLYLERGKLHVGLLGRGTSWLDTGAHDSLLEAAQFVHLRDNRTGLKMARLEEIACPAGLRRPAFACLVLRNFTHRFMKTSRSILAAALVACSPAFLPLFPVT